MWAIRMATLPSAALRLPGATHARAQDLVGAHDGPPRIALFGSGEPRAGPRPRDRTACMTGWARPASALRARHREQEESGVPRPAVGTAAGRARWGRPEEFQAWRTKAR